MSVKELKKETVLRGGIEEPAVKGNINGKLIAKDETHLVHFYQTDYSQPHSSDITDNFKFPKKKKAMSEAEFLSCFSSPHTKYFGKVATVKQLYDSLCNLNAARIKEAFAEEINNSQRKGQLLSPGALNDYIEKLLKKHSKLTLNGYNIVVRKEDFIHIPNA